jgi:hypothetical protein
VQFWRDAADTTSMKKTDYPLKIRKGNTLVAIYKNVIEAHQTKPCFMHQRSGLKRLAGSFLSQLGSGEPPQFVVNEDKQLLGSF